MVASPIKTTKLSFGVSHQLKPLAMGERNLLFGLDACLLAACHH
jgi:hypothetical protein